MKNVTWKYIKPLEDNACVEKYLAKHGVNIPKKIVECIKENNGGRPSPNLFDTEYSKEYVFKSLLSYNENDRETIYSVYPHMFKNNKLFPIGTDASGNFICVDLKNEDILVLWNHENNRKEIIDFLPQLM